ncbi:hypothetical protein B0H13DRAFT_1850212 [Mycena leptocephala]|nr:hypothetical protein B0H13DRAFT_1850212 [Mycena leptocephala]
MGAQAPGRSLQELPNASWLFGKLSPLVFHEYIQLIGESHNLTDGIDVLSMMYQLLNRALHVPSGDSVAPEMQQEITGLEKAEKRSPTVFEKIAQLKWNQYLALMRRDGEYGPTDLNAVLTAPILPSVQTQWHLGVNVEIPALLSVFFAVLPFFFEKGTQLNYKQELKDDLDNTIQTLQVRSSTNVDTLNMTFIRDSAHTVFESLNGGTRIAFAGSVGEVQSEPLDGIKRILRDISLFFIGFDTMSRDLEGLALLKTILLDKEDHIFATSMCSVKRITANVGTEGAHENFPFWTLFFNLRPIRSYLVQNCREQYFSHQQ